MIRDDRPRLVMVVTAAVTARLFLQGYAAYLADAGYDVHMIADDIDDLAPDMAEAGVTVHSVPMSRDPDLRRDIASLSAMVGLLRVLRPEVAVYATPKASLLTSIAARISRTPVRVYSLWGIRFETSTGLGRIVLRGLERLTAAASTAVVANSESLADRASILGITRRSKITVPGHGSSHGVDSVRFDPDRDLADVDEATGAFLADRDAFTIGYVGRLHPDKGVDTLVEAAALFASRGEDIRFVLVGGDEGALPADLERLSNVHLAGEVADVRPYLARFDLLVLMSLREGFPNVVLEAAAMRVPAIVSDATGCVDSVVDGLTGVVVARGDTQQLVRDIESLRGDDAGRLAMGAAARDRAIRDFEPRDVWGAYEQHIAAQLLKVRTRSAVSGSRGSMAGARRKQDIR